MTKKAVAGQLVENVLIDGQEVPLGGQMTVEEAKSELMEVGILPNIVNAQAVMVNPNTVEFVNQRGENGLK